MAQHRMHPHQIASFEHKGNSLSYEIHGSGDKTLVYLHGLLLDAGINRRLARNLADLGFRVILLDLPGHGSSDKPLGASQHRMDAYADCVIGLLDHLGLDRAVVGGMSLGADVSLFCAVQAPDRIAGMILEMPVLESATPYAAMLFTPILAFVHYAAPAVRMLTRYTKMVSRDRIGPLDHVWGALSLEPEEMVAVLHGVLVGPIGPTAAERAAIKAPALVIGHDLDFLHPLGDADRIARQLPNAELVKARSMFELRIAPARITGRIAQFLDEVYGDALESSVRKRA